ncbi:CheR family methyltransferase [Pelagivirga sediminicola]|nr:CheR family methyltransferase [Pelagivirga sediminicola]
MPLIVGIGASAGGIAAVSQLLNAVPKDSGMAFIVVTHLNPDRESLLQTVLAQKTEMTIRIAEDGAAIEVGTVYVMPEAVLLTVEDGRLKLTGDDPNSRERKPIDLFFAALAEDQKENAVAIVLSGGAGDGTLGVKVIKENGGITMAQVENGHAPLNPEMPQSAIATGLVDFALPPADMPAKLIEIREGRATLDALVLAAGKDGTARPRDVQARISRKLREVSGHDFSGYKSKTFFRRVARRMQVRRIPDLAAYCDLLDSDTEEVTALFRDLLISVTNFFRDADAFAALETAVIPEICKDRSAAAPVRIWVPACTTGEEVYSLAILLHEHMGTDTEAPPVQIFGTDIDDPALSIARQARYPEQLLRGVSAERLERYFVRDGASYMVCKKVREMCIFSPHNVIGDPPFSRMDMVSCRNLLIYFGPELQQQIIPTFHYALKPGGYLFLGTSESISHYSNLFDTIDKKHRIFQAKDHPSRHWSPGELTQRSTSGSAGNDRPEGLSGIQLRHKVERHILDRHTPAHAVVRQTGEIVFASGGTGGLLELPRGEPTNHLLDMVPKNMRLELRALLRQVVENERPAQRANITVTAPTGQRQRLTVKVEPLRGHGLGERLFMVLFQITDDTGAQHGGADADRSTEAAEDEVREMRERLQSTVEEYETALEELKSSNEELVSVNEEAQSTNEELEASREEMQSLNEELNTINAELSGKIEELDRANTDMRNLFEATQIATVFLDANLSIRSFTPAAAALFALRAADVGRPLSELASVSDYPELNTHIDQVLQTGTVLTHRLHRYEGKSSYLVRITPYLSGAQDKVEGAVVTLVDITHLAEAEAQQKVLIEELNHRVRNMLAVVSSIVRTSLRGKNVPTDVVETLTNRLHGMARAYGLLSETAWTAVGLRDIAAQELSPFGAESSTMEGPAVQLQPAQALAVGMIMHELATNAAKYGALSRRAGRVKVTWAQEDGHVLLDWAETGGPAVEPPGETGFGFVLIRGQAEQQLDGEVDVDFASGGLHLKLKFPLPS